MIDFAKVTAARNAGYSDEEIASYLGDSYGLSDKMQSAFDAGYSASEVIDHFAPKEPEPQKDSGDTWRGVKTAAKQLPQLGYGLIAGAGAVAESTFGEGGLSTDLKNYGVEKYQAAGADIAKDAKESDSLTYSWDQAKEGNYGAMVDWLQYGIGYGGVQALEALASGGIGAIVGKATLKQTAEHLAAGMVNKEVARIAATAEGSALAADVVSKMAVANIATKIGQTVGIGAQAFGMEGGEIFGGLAEQSVKSGESLTGAEIAKGLGATLAAGGLEFVGDKLGVDIMLGKSRLFKPAAGMTGLGGKAARAGVAGAAAIPLEAGTEYLQTGLEEYGQGKEANILPWNQSAEAQRQAFDAAGLGGLGGGVMAVGGGLLSKPAPQPTDPIRDTLDTMPATPVDSLVDDFLRDNGGDTAMPNVDELLAATEGISNDQAANTPEQPATGLLGIQNNIGATMGQQPLVVGSGALPLDTAGLLTQEEAPDGTINVAASPGLDTEAVEGRDIVAPAGGGDGVFRHEVAAGTGGDGLPGTPVEIDAGRGLTPSGVRADAVIPETKLGENIPPNIPQQPATPILTPGGASEALSGTPRPETPEDVANKEWAANYSKVTGDIPAATDKEIERAIGYASKRITAYQPKAFEGDANSKSMIVSLNAEVAGLEQEQQRRKHPTPQSPATPLSASAPKPDVSSSWTEHPAAKKLQAIYEAAPQAQAGRIERAQDDMRAILERSDSGQIQGAITRLRTAVAATKALAPIKADIDGVIAEGVNRAMVPNRAQYDATIKAQEALPEAARDESKLSSARTALKLIEKYGEQPQQQLAPTTPVTAGVSTSAPNISEALKPAIEQLIKRKAAAGQVRMGTHLAIAINKAKAAMESGTGKAADFIKAAKPFKGKDEQIHTTLMSIANALEPVKSTEKKPQKKSSDLLQRIKQLGGIDASLALDITGEQRAPGGWKFAFRKGGENVDNLATQLAAEGFMIDTGDVDGGMQQLRNMIRAHIGGERNFKVKQIEEQAAAEEHSGHMDALVRDAERLGINWRNLNAQQLEDAVYEAEDALAMERMDAELELDDAEREAFSELAADETVADDELDIPFGDNARVDQAAMDAHFNFGANNEESNDGQVDGVARTEQAQGAERGARTGATSQADQGEVLQSYTNQEVLDQEAAREAAGRAEEAEIRRNADRMATEREAATVNRNVNTVASDNFQTIETKETDKGVALFSQSSTPASNPHTLSTLSAAIDKAMGDGFTKLLEATGKFKLITSDQIDTFLKGNPDIRYSKDGRILAFVIGGQTYLAADNISQTDDNVKGLLHHEIGVHALSLGRNEPEFKAILKQFVMMGKMGNEKVQAAQSRVPKDTPAHLVDEEALGYYLEANHSLTFSQKVVAWFKVQLRKLGNKLPVMQRMQWFRWADKLTVEDVVYMAQQALKSAPSTLGQAQDRGTFKAETSGNPDERGVEFDREKAGRERYRRMVEKLKALYGGENGYESLIDSADRYLRRYSNPSQGYLEELYAARKLKEGSEAVRQRLLEQGASAQGGGREGAAAFATLESRGRGFGHFDGYVTEASLQDIQHYGNYFAMEVWPLEFDGKDGALDSPILTLTINPSDDTSLSQENPHGELTIYGPKYDSETFRILQARGWAEVAKGKDGEIAYLPDGKPWTRLTGSSPAQLTALLSEAHARIRLATEAPHLGINWDRATGATGFATEHGDKDVSRKGAIYFSKSQQSIPAAQQPPAKPKSRIVGDAGRQYTPEQRAAMARTGSVVTEKSRKETLQTLWQGAGKKLAQGIVDQFRPIRDLDDHAYTLMRLSKGATGAFEAFMHHGKLSIKDGAFDADTSGGVLEKVFYPLGKESTDFLRWVAGNRAERLKAAGLERLFADEDIAAFKSLADGKADFDYTMPDGTVTRDRTLIYRDSLKKFNEANKNVLDMAEQSGLIDGASRKLWEHEFYVPFYRTAVEEDGGVRGMNIKSGVIRQQAFHKLKGGEQQLNDLLENTLMNWAHLIDASAKNRAATATLKAAEKVGAARKAVTGEKKTVWFMEDGQKAEYKVEDPYLMEAISSLEYAGLRGGAMDAMSKMKHWLTIGVTASPFFKVRNLIRDSVQAIGTASNSDLSYNPLANVKKGFKLTDRKNAAQEYVSALAGGGLIRFGTMLEGSEAKRTRQLIKQGSKDSHILDNESKVRALYDKYLEPALAVYNELGNRGEEINRMALYDTLIKQGMDHATASLMARDLMDFSMQGTWTSVRFLTQIVPFMNARLQGLYKLGRATQDDKARFAIVLGATAMASLALLAAYGDDDDWKQREDWDRDNYWWFKIGGEAFRIPKPFEIGAIATLAERSAELVFDKEMTGGRFVSLTLGLAGNQLAMNPTPQVFKPIIDLYANKDSFTGRDIESMGMERLASEYRFKESTSLVARGISTAGNTVTGGHFFSPLQVDHVARAYFGWLGSFAVGAADETIRYVSGNDNRPSRDMWKFATGSMVSSLDGAQSRYVSQMYQQARELEEAYGTWRRLQKEGKTEEAKEYREDNKDKLAKYRRVENIKKQASQINERIRGIERGNLDSDEKRRRINNLRKQQDVIARRLVAP